MVVAQLTASGVGGIADDFTLPNLNGDGPSLATYLNGKRGAVVVFWSSMCPSCALYDSYLNSLSVRWPDLAVIAVASRSGETEEQISRSVVDRKLAFPVFHDRAGAVARHWEIDRAPCVFLIDRDRKVLYRGSIDNGKPAPDPGYRSYLNNAIDAFR